MVAAVVDTCKYCKRPVLSPLGDCKNAHKPPVRCAVKHDYFGCDTGCCGHSVYGYDEAGNTVFRNFVFHHPWDLQDQPDHGCAWAEELAAEHLPGILFVFEDCELSDD
jgi:hypothetical protein